ncbi:hypothetical protein BsWGS_27556 [Bradybaena similaris]
MHKIPQHQLANPFASATVVVADQFVDTFPHPQGLLAYLHRLCLQLDVDIVSLERPVVVKGSWKTIIKIDAFLKMLISSLHSAISEGVVPSEEDFNAAFSQFEEEGSCRSECTENKHESQEMLLSNELSELKTDDYLDIIKTDEGRFDSNMMDKWYFNSNPRGKTMDKRKRCSDSGKQPPEPYIIVEADDTRKTNQASLVEIEHVLSQVYRKETIEKYQKRSTASVCDKHTHPAVFSGDFDFAKEEIVQLDDHDENKPQEQFINMEKRPHMLMENVSSDSLTNGRNSISSKELNQFEINLNCAEKEVVSVSEISEKTNDEDTRPVRLRLTVRQNRLDRGKTVEIVNKDLTVIKRQKKHRRSGRKRKKCKGSCEDMKQVANHKTLKHVRIKEMLPVENRRVTRQDKKANSENVSKQASEKNKTNSKSNHHKVNKKAASKQCSVISDIEHETKNTCISLIESRVESKTSIQICHPEENGIEVKKNNIKKETQDHQYSCDQCSYSTIKHIQLLEHKRRVHLTKRFRCEECLKEFGFLKDLRRHMKCHAKADNCCDICGKKYKEARKLTEHKRTHADGYVKPEFPCKFCMKVFSTKYVLAYHIKADHLGMKCSYICPTCGKSFSQKNSYLQHANVHLGIRPFTCEICGKRFSYDKSLKEHKFMHNNEKVFSCSFCSKSFRQASGLAIHLKVHKTTKDYVCSMCGKGFSQKQALVRHERIHAGDKPYECALCKRTFADASVLRRHMILIHKKDPKLWREDTKCYVPKRTDFFISVLNGDTSSADNSQNTASRELENQQRNEFCQQEMHHKQFQFEQGQHGSDETSRSLPVIAGNYESSAKKKLPFFNKRETVVEEAGGYTAVSCADMKLYAGYGSEKNIVSDEMMSSIGAAEHLAVEHVRFSASASQIHSPVPLQMHGSLPTSAPHSQIHSPVPLQMHGSFPTSEPQGRSETHLQNHVSFSALHAQSQLNSEPGASSPSFVPHPGQTSLSSSTSFVPHHGQTTSSSSTSFVPHHGQTSSSSSTSFVPHPGQTTSSSSFVPHPGQTSSSSFVPHPGQTTSSSFVPHTCQTTLSSTSSFVPHPGQTSSSFVPHPGQTTSSSASFVPHPGLTAAASSFVPGAYQHRQISYDPSTVEMQPVQYSAMLTQPYAQTIVLLQDSIGAIAYHQPGLNVAFSSDTTVPGGNLQHISPSLSMTPSPLPPVAAMSQAISSLSSGQIYDQVLSTSNKLPQ